MRIVGAMSVVIVMFVICGCVATTSESLIGIYSPVSDESESVSRELTLMPDGTILFTTFVVRVPPIDYVRGGVYDSTAEEGVWRVRESRLELEFRSGKKMEFVVSTDGESILLEDCSGNGEKLKRQAEPEAREQRRDAASFSREIHRS